MLWWIFEWAVRVWMGCLGTWLCYEIFQRDGWRVDGHVEPQPREVPLTDQVLPNRHGALTSLSCPSPLTSRCSGPESIVVTMASRWGLQDCWVQLNS